MGNFWLTPTHDSVAYKFKRDFVTLFQYCWRNIIFGIVAFLGLIFLNINLSFSQHKFYLLLKKKIYIYRISCFELNKTLGWCLYLATALFYTPSSPSILP